MLYISNCKDNVEFSYPTARLLGHLHFPKEITLPCSSHFTLHIFLPVHFIIQCSIFSIV